VVRMFLLVGGDFKKYVNLDQIHCICDSHQFEGSVEVYVGGCEPEHCCIIPDYEAKYLVEEIHQFLKDQEMVIDNLNAGV